MDLGLKKSIARMDVQDDKYLKKFHKRLKIGEFTFPTEIDEAVLKFAKTTKKPWEIALTEDQLNDKEFLLNLYKTNSSTTAWFKPSKKLQQDTNFMFEFFKITYDLNLQTRPKWPWNFDYSIRECQDAIKNPAFVEKITQEYPQEMQIWEFENQQIEKYENAEMNL